MTLRDLFKTLDLDATEFVLVAPNKHTRKIEVHIHLPFNHVDAVQGSINRVINNMRNNCDLH